VLILAVVGGCLAWTWLRDVGSTQHKVVPTFPIVFFGTAALVVWLVLLSRLPGRARLAIALGVAAVAGLGLLLLEIKGVDGNLVPIVGYRWAGERLFDDATGSSSEATAPGPHDYPQFYGPGRRASLPGPALDPDWSRRPPRELWRRTVGEGWASLAVVGQAAVTHEQRGEDEVVARYDLGTGRQVWIHAHHAPFNTTVGGSGPRTTPSIDDGRVYVLGATGVLSCLDLEDGRRLWSRNVLRDHGAGQPDWGMASSPLVAGELVMVQLGNRGNGLAAYDRTTGEPAWRVGHDSGTYTSPLLATVAGLEQVLVVYHTFVIGHDPVTGEILWQHEWPNPGGERVTMPLVIGDDRLLVSAGYGVGSRMLRLARTEAGLEAELVWESRRLKSKFAPMVFHEGVVYGLDDGVLVALDPETGERLWKRGRYGHGQLIRVGNVLLVQAENGDVVLVAARPDEHRRLASLSALPGKTWNPPALSGQVLLVRNDREAAAFELPVGREESAGTRISPGDSSRMARGTRPEGRDR
jgi:outer membrane protein assembly factor BamB